MGGDRVPSVYGGSGIRRGIVFSRIVRRAGRRLPSTLFVPYVLGVLWFRWPPSTLAAIEMATSNHAWQYLPCVHRAEVALARERGEPHPVYAWLCAFSAAMAGRLLLARWLPAMTDNALSRCALPGWSARCSLSR